jgi:hypothetical protein
VLGLMTKFRGFPGVSGFRVTYVTTDLRVLDPKVVRVLVAGPGLEPGAYWL